MDEAAWLASADPTPMLEFLGENASERKARLFGCACCRGIWNLLTEVALQEAVEVAEQYADGLANAAALEATYQRASATYYATFLAHDAGSAAREAHLRTHIATSVAAADRRFFNYYTRRSGSAQRAGESAPDEEVRRCELVRDIFGNPFRPVAPDPSWLAWNDGTVRKLAQTIYDDRAFDRLLPFLADALEEAGCTDKRMLNHSRGWHEIALEVASPGERIVWAKLDRPHVRGCWVLDLLLGRA